MVKLKLVETHVCLISFITLMQMRSRVAEPYEDRRAIQSMRASCDAGLFARAVTQSSLHVHQHSTRCAIHKVYERARPTSSSGAV